MKKPVIRYEKTLDLRYLLHEIIKKWYLLVVVSLVLAIAAGTMEFLINGAPRTESVLTQDEIASFQGNYEEKEQENIQLEEEYLQVFNKLRTLNKKLAVNKKILIKAEQEELTVNNVLKWIDAAREISQSTVLISENRQKIAELKQSISANKEDMQYYLEKMEETVEVPFYASKITLKSILGAILGVLVVCVGILLKCCFNYRLQYENQIADQFGIALLGSLGDKDWDYPVMAAKLLVLAGEKEQILLCGTIDQNQLEKICDEFRKAVPDGAQRFSVAGCLTDNAENILKIRDSAVVMVESVGRTEMKALSRLISFFAQSNNEVVGVIIC